MATEETPLIEHGKSASVDLQVTYLLHYYSCIFI